jgi:DnaA-homolog protein
MPEQLPIKFEFWGNQTFADFFPANNLDILTQLRQAASGQGETFIYLWGEPGYGKTHLLTACCEEAFNRQIRAFYLDLSRGLPLEAMLDGLEANELVCLDNVQAICGNREQETALFHFFNRHREAGNRLIVAADRPAGQLGCLLPDLQTRLNWGLSLKLRCLNEDEKFSLLIHKAQQLGFELNPAAARFLLTHYDRRLSSLWSALDTLDLASLAAKRKLTIPFLKEVLSL